MPKYGKLEDRICLELSLVNGQVGSQAERQGPWVSCLTSLYLLNETCTGLSTGENCEVRIFSYITYDCAAQWEMFLWPGWTCTVDSLRALLLSENFIKPHSKEHLLVHLLTAAL